MTKEPRRTTQKWFAMLNMSIPRTLQRSYECPNCGLFVVYHKGYTFNKVCFNCNSKVRNVPNDTISDLARVNVNSASISYSSILDDIDISKSKQIVDSIRNQNDRRKAIGG